MTATAATERPRARLAPWRGLLVLLLGEGTQRLLSFGAIWWLTQALGPERYAPVEVTLAAMMFAALAVELGFPLFGAREVARDRDAAERLVPRVVPTQIALAALLAAAAWGARAAGLLAPELAALLPGYALSLLLLPLLLGWVFQGRGEMGWVALPGVARQAAFVAGTALLIRRGGEATALPWIECGAVGVAALLALGAWSRRRGAGRPRLAIDPRLAAEAAPMGLSQLLWSLRMYLATLLLWRLVPRESVSEYAVAHRLMMVLQALLTTYFVNLYPGLARAVRGPRAELAALLRRSLALAVGATLVVALVAAFGARELLLVVFRARYASGTSAACLVRLAFVLPVLACRGHARMTLLALGRGRSELVVSLLGTVLLALLIPWWTRAAGPSGAASALLASELAATLLTFALLRGTWRTLPTGAAAGAEP